MIRPFQLHRPTTIAEATATIAELPEAAYYRGGTELLQVMKMGLARFDHLVDLKRIPELRGITAQPDGSIRIGSATTHAEIERSAVVRGSYPALAELERQVANPRIRNVGSIGGNLCFAEPHSDPATFLLVADARLELSGPGGSRTLTVDAFLLGALETDLAHGELLVAIVLPAPARGTAIAYRRIALVERPAASVACRLTIRDGVAAETRLAVGSVGERPQLAPTAAAIVDGVARAGLEAAAEAAAASLAEACEVEDEPGTSIEYRRHLVGVLARRAILAAAEAADDR